MKKRDNEQLKQKSLETGEGDKTAKRIVLVGGSILIVITALFLGIFLTVKNHETEEPSSTPEMTETESRFSAGMYYNMETGYTHALAQEELNSVQDIFKDELLGIQISYEEYTALSMSLSNNGYADVSFLELSTTDEADITILYHDGFLYFENSSAPNVIWRLQSEEENVERLKNVMDKLSLLQQMEDAD